MEHGQQSEASQVTFNSKIFKCFKPLRNMLSPFDGHIF